MKLLKQVMKDKHIKQKVLADRIGMSQAAISCYCVGRHKPSKKTAYLIALALRYDGEPMDLFKEV